MIENELRILWEQRLAEYEASGQNVTAWCKKQSVKVNQFYYWRRKLSADQAENDQPVKWLPLDLDLCKQASLFADSIAVHVGQVTVEIRKGFDQNLFREIVQILQTI